MLYPDERISKMVNKGYEHLHYVPRGDVYRMLKEMRDEYEAKLDEMGQVLSAVLAEVDKQEAV